VTAWYAGIPSSHLHRLIIPDDALIQFDLLMISIVLLLLLLLKIKNTLGVPVGPQVCF